MNHLPIFMIVPMYHKIHTYLFTSLLALLLLGCEQPDPAPANSKVSSTDDISSEITLEWTQLQRTLAKESPSFTPPETARALGYCTLVLYESTILGSDKYKSLVGQLQGFSTLPTLTKEKIYHWPTLINAAQAAACRQYFPLTALSNAKVLALEAKLNEKYKPIDATDVLLKESKEAGIALADAIFTYAKTDGGHEGYRMNFPSTFVVPTGVGLWEPTENKRTIPLLPTWGDNRTFHPDNQSFPFPIIFTPSYNQSSAFFKMYEEVYKKNSRLTQEEKEIAVWWADDPSETFTPAGHSQSLASIVIQNEGTSLSLSDAAHVFAKVSLAVSDAFVACWKVKYRFMNERPYTYVRKTIDPNWIPFWPSPPFPGFTSGHATQSATAATVLASIFGENYTFIDVTWVGRPRDTKRNVDFRPRRFTTFWQTALEAADSRFFGGIHTRLDNELGLQEGKRIGQRFDQLSWKK